MTEIFFPEQKLGYDKDQVDSYIIKLTKAYQTLFDEYQTVSGKYNDLLGEYKKQESRVEEKAEKPGLNVDLIAKVLVDAEILAQKIIADAKEEAAKVAERTNKNLEQACDTMRTAVNEVQILLATR